MSLPSTTLPDLIDQLLTPISADAPCGVDLRYEREFDQLRDLRRNLPYNWVTNMLREYG